uniref:Menorin-like domain-containing protein n=1 Tax=Pyramimonas obovata TaxID=1411642 RepID=A0A7S0WNM7_9CHLO|mmetsp:Transcript_32402/g.70752  ORF Transcript_32402/g.70752 Transcript_32402/m.70752 type:complete len:331 (+) Transcript_32402:368-1360(+)|eukprot:CAMPEP_0118949108 /NCGR_PEP_ID=MMETSP1169-20130426/49046_1 /TAXON_ID=36882 /ORGANISM="Pyramimonas obovata, Strain CCMP722" /LENGTH=330 /DNA_ID=CAMNT_0006895667 /DNA_START=357 /DNA_END=1349 /DNA_ORIENTATION=-
MEGLKREPEQATLASLLAHFGLESPVNLVWSHATNSHALLKESLEGGKVHMIEADILMGRHETDGGEGGAEIPIMAHPPATSSDLSFAEFARSVREQHANGGRRIGVKLDFKDPKAVVPVLQNLTSEGVGENSPVWVNADIWQGPGGAVPKFNAMEFLAACRKYCPYASLSVGWTTGPGGLHGIPGALIGTAGYRPKHIDVALRDLRAAGILPHEGNSSAIEGLDGRNETTLITFPVSVIYTRISAKRTDTFDRLLSASEGCTLTLWGEDTVSGSRYVESGAMSKYKGKIFVDTKPPKFAGVLFEHQTTLSVVLFTAVLAIPVLVFILQM